MIQLPIGKEFLELVIEDPKLEHQLCRWYRFPETTTNSLLGSVFITEVAEDFSGFPTLPVVEWVDDVCVFKATGCLGEVGCGKAATLAISQPFPIFLIEQFLRVVTAISVFRSGSLFVHSAGLLRNGKGYLFSGYSGAGKTTICRISHDCQVLNDDLVILYPGEHKWTINATPFSNPTQVQPGNGSGPLDMIVHLKQAPLHEIRSVPFHEALSKLISHAPVISAAPQFSEELFKRCLEIIQKTETCELSFTPDDGFWQLIEENFP